jgi:peptide/nickel transport system substrate-binding protein
VGENKPGGTVRLTDSGNRRKRTTPTAIRRRRRLDAHNLTVYEEVRFVTHRRRSTKLLASLFAFALLAAACGDDDDDGGAGGGDPETTETTAGGEAATGGSVTIAGEQLPSSFNYPHVDHNAFWTALWMDLVWPQVSLFQPDGTFEFNTELLAEEPEVTSEDPQVITYRINPDANWSDGTPISADDFVFTWESQNGALGEEIDPESGEPLPLYNAASTAGYSDQTCEAEDEKTVVCTYDTPYADWYALFNPVQPLHAYVEQGNGDAVVGFNEGFAYPATPATAVPSGNWFKVEAVDGEETLTLTRNEDYYGEPANLDELIIRWITDPTQEPAALENGEVDVIFPQAQIDLVQQTEGMAGVTSIVDFGTFFEHMDFNFSNVHLAKAEVRQAIGKAVNRQEIVDRLPGQMSPDAEVMNHHIFYPGGAAYQPNGEAEYAAQDLEAANALLESAGYTLGGDGVYTHPTDGRLSVRFAWRDPNPRRSETAQLVQASLAEAGIELQLTPQPDFTFLGQGDFDIVIFGWTSITVPSGHTDIFASDGGSNNGRYANEEVDALFTDADQELDEDARSDLLNQIDEILWEDLPVLPLFQVPEFLAFSDSVTGVEHNGYDGFMYNAAEWSIAG